MEESESTTARISFIVPSLSNWVKRTFSSVFFLKMRLSISSNISCFRTMYASSIFPEHVSSFALCSFGNFGSIAIQIGGIGELAPNQRKNLARLSIRALICGTLSCYMSAAIVGVLL